jgi:PAS domain S-box-containing protein
VLITTRGDIVHFHGRTAAYLEPPRGQPSLNIFRMAREGLDRVLLPAIQAALVQEAPVVRSGVTVTTNGSTVTADVIVERVNASAALQGLLLVTFRPVAADATPAASASTSPPPPRRRRRLLDVERELQETRESLQNTIEVLEATNEELTSANEELQSTNEEMQSANEELKTSREEMQSLNEELQTVNAELHSKVDALSHANDDMTNLLNSTDIATIFLDDALQIKRFTTQATQVMALIPSDVGRPVSDLTSHLDYTTLVADAHEVLRTLIAQEKEVRTYDGRWYLVRLLPYRTSENVIDGLVITFVDITHTKRAEEARQHAMDQLETEVAERRRTEERLQHLSKVFQEATVPILLEDIDGRITDLNAEAERAYGWRREELLGQPMLTLVPAEYHSQTDTLLASCHRGEDLRDVETVRRTKAGEMMRVLLTVSPLTNPQGEITGMVTIAKNSVNAS